MGEREERPEAGSASGLIRMLGAALLFLALVQVETIALSLCRVSISQPVAVGILLLAGAGAIVFGRLGRRRWPGVEADGAPARPLPAWRRLLPVLIALLMLVLVNSWLHPYLGADCAIFHLPAIHFWGEAGRVHWIRMEPQQIYYADMFINAYPKAAELVAFVGVRATGMANLVHTLNAWFLPLGILGSACIARRLGASLHGALAAGLLFALMPVSVQQLNGTYVDAAFASAIVALLAVVLHVISTAGDHGLPWTAALALGASGGLVAGIKTSGLLYVTVGFVALLPALTRAAWRRPRGMRARFAVRLVSALLLALLALLLTGGYWYARNALHTGNPVFPMAVKLGGLFDWPGLPREHVMNEAANIPPDTAGLPDWGRVLVAWAHGGPSHWPFSGCSVSGRLGGLGLIWLLGGLPAAVWLLLSRRSARLFALAAVVAALFLLTPMHWWARYTLWLQGFGLACLVVAMEREWPGRARRPVAAWLGVLLFLTLAELASGIGWVACSEPVDWYGGLAPFPPRPRIALDRLTWNRPFRGIDEESRGTAYRRLMTDRQAVALGPLSSLNSASIHMIGMFGAVCDPGGRRRVHFVKPNVFASPDAFGRLLRERRIGYLVLDADVRIPSWTSEFVAYEETAGRFRYLVVAPGVMGPEPPDPGRRPGRSAAGERVPGEAAPARAGACCTRPGGLV